MRRQFDPPVERAAAYCTYCPKLCRFSCPAAEAENRETVTPWGLMRLLEFARTGSIEVDDDVAETFFHCMGCGRCTTWCKHENDVTAAMWQAREWMADLDRLPQELRGFLEFFLEENSPHPDSPDRPELIDSEVFDPASAVVYMPDCETHHHYPELITRVGALIHAVTGVRPRLHTRHDTSGHACCGFPLLSAGHRAAYLDYARDLRHGLGDVDVVLTDCAAMAAMHRNGNSFGVEPMLPVQHMIEWLDENLDDVPIKDRVSADGRMFHDSCFVTRHLDLGDATRRVLAQVLDGPIAEFHVNGKDAPCCGGPAHYHVVARDASRRCASDRLDAMEREGGSSIVCGSATCKKAFRRAAGSEENSMDVLSIVCDAVGV